MHHFGYVGGALHAEGVSLAAHRRGGRHPLLLLFDGDAGAALPRAGSRPSPASTRRICYAIKANSNQAVIATLARLGAGMDVVSEGELRRARAAGVAADKIIFAGVGKTRAEMAYALQEGILGFNVESEPSWRR